MNLNKFKWNKNLENDISLIINQDYYFCSPKFDVMAENSAKCMGEYLSMMSWRNYR